MENLAGEFEELRSALQDVGRGVYHPRFKTVVPAGTRRSAHRDSSQMQRARANLALAIEARHALLKMDKTREAESTTLRIAAEDVLKRDNFALVLQIASKTSRGRLTRGDVNKEAEKNSLKKMALQWRKNLSSRASNPEAAELYAVTHDLIRMCKVKLDQELLQRIESRCLKHARLDGTS